MSSDERIQSPDEPGTADRRFAIMAPLRPVRAGDEYRPGEWPLHVTLLGPFTIAHDADTVLRLIDGAHPQAAIRVSAVSREMFGPDHDIPVTELEHSLEVRELHDVLLEILVAAGAVIDGPAFTGDGYRPHVSDSVEGRIDVGEVVTLESLAVLDMQPEGRRDLRRFVGSTRFSAGGSS